MCVARNPKPVLRDKLEGWDGEGGGSGVQEGGDLCIPNEIHVVIWQKPSQYKKVIIL